MRVDLAAQVLSESVAGALRKAGVKDTVETIRFVEMMDRFFDCLNVNNFSASQKKIKVFQSPYTSTTDFRLTWLKKEFRQYLREWESSVHSMDIPTKEQNKKLLSQETRYGIDVTVSSFIVFHCLSLSIPGVKSFLSERLSQDPLEKLFGCQRQRGGAANNPNVQSFCKNSQALRVINSTCADISRSNCRGHKVPLKKTDHCQNDVAYID